MSKKIIAAAAAGLRNNRPWVKDTDYVQVMSAGPANSAYYMFLTWELTANSVADKLRDAIGRSKFDRNAFMVATGAYVYTCAHCYEKVIPCIQLGCRCTAAPTSG